MQCPKEGTRGCPRARRDWFYHVTLKQEECFSSFCFFFFFYLLLLLLHLLVTPGGCNLKTRSLPDFLAESSGRGKFFFFLFFIIIICVRFLAAISLERRSDEEEPVEEAKKASLFISSLLSSIYPSHSLLFSSLLPSLSLSQQDWQECFALQCQFLCAFSLSTWTYKLGAEKGEENHYYYYYYYHSGHYK